MKAIEQNLRRGGRYGINDLSIPSHFNQLWLNAGGNKDFIGLLAILDPQNLDSIEIQLDGSRLMIHDWFFGK